MSFKMLFFRQGLVFTSVWPQHGCSRQKAQTVYYNSLMSLLSRLVLTAALSVVYDRLTVADLLLKEVPVNS